MASTLTLPQAKVELEKLIACGEVQYNSSIIGCCKNYFVTFPNDSQKYKYNINKLISNKLRNKISSHLYNMPPKTLNKKTKTPTNTDTLDVDLKFDRDAEEDRSWGSKDRFPEFEYDYQDAQDNSALNTTSSVEFEIHINLRKVRTNPSQRTEEVKKILVSMTTILGGTNGVKLFIKKKIMEMIYAYENSGIEVSWIKIIKLYVKKQKQQLKLNFREIKMYGTLFN